MAARILASYFDGYLDVARKRGTGFVFETPTWRANPDWGRGVGYGQDDLEQVNRDAIAWAREIAETSGVAGPAIVSGSIGPRGDGSSSRR